jgi:hypothetical protein
MPVCIVTEAFLGEMIPCARKIIEKSSLFSHSLEEDKEFFLH